MTLTIYVVRGAGECPFHGVDFAWFPFHCFSSFRKRNSRNFFALTLTVCPGVCKRSPYLPSLFSQGKFQELKRCFDYVISRVLMYLHEAFKYSLIYSRSLFALLAIDFASIVLYAKNTYKCFSMALSNAPIFLTVVIPRSFLFCLSLWWNRCFPHNIDVLER